jgi:hypothetical protein
MIRRTSVLLAVPLTLGLLAAEAPPAAELKACREAVSRFAGALMDELGKAMESSGPKEAVAVCRDRAPQVAARIAEESGIALRRTALRVRNPKNEPDAWERATLESFEARRAKGEAMEAMEASEVVVEGDRRILRYMKAIPTKSPCLTCHGSEVDPSLMKTIREAYPSDAAVGFAGGDLRGAFSLRKPLGAVEPKTTSPP